VDELNVELLHSLCPQNSTPDINSKFFNFLKGKLYY
jgi:hypothetical protein